MGHWQGIFYGLLSVFFWAILWVALFSAGCTHWHMPIYRHTGFTVGGNYGGARTELPAVSVGHSTTKQWGVNVQLHFQNVADPPIQQVILQSKEDYERETGRKLEPIGTDRGLVFDSDHDDILFESDDDDGTGSDSVEPRSPVQRPEQYDEGEGGPEDLQDAPRADHAPSDETQ